VRAGLLIAPALAATIAACGTPAQERFDDPFAYCAAVGAIDAPDDRYAGPVMPAAIANGLKAAMGVPQEAPSEPFRDHATWRCMSGKVYACTFGANLPCEERADTGRAPTSGISGFCRDHPHADFIPLAATGRATVYAWRCAGATPAIERQLAEPDASGYLANIWHEIAPPED
jgi:hypothetical protein